MSVVTQDGTDLGCVGDIVFDRETGDIRTLEVTAGATANTLLGKREIPVDLIKGFRWGIGRELGTFDEETEERQHGAILVDDAAKAIATEGGLAEKAGEATAVASNKAHEAVDNVVKPAAHAAGEAVNKGAYATGRQLVRAKGMFSNFKEEYDKASGKTPAKPGKSTAMAAASAVEDDEDIEVIYVDEYGNVVEDDAEAEIVYVDEDGNEIADEDEFETVYIDEDGNPVDIDDDEDDVVIVAGARGVKSSGASGSTAHAVGAHLKKASGMFSGFKEEFDKAKK